MPRDYDKPLIPSPTGGPMGQAAEMFNVGLQGVGQAIQYNSEKEREQREQDAGLLAKGFLRDADPKSPTYNQVKRDPNAQAAYEQDLAEKDPASPASGLLRQYYKAALQQTNPELAGAISDNMSAYQLKMYEKQLGGLVGKQAGALPAKQRFEETTNQNSVKAGQTFENDPIIKASKVSGNSLTRSQSILENPNKPVTTKDLNLAYNDYINAVAAGGAATEGKIQRELPETWEQTWNDFKARAGQFDDIRKDETGKKLLGMLLENIRTVRNDLKSATADQASNIAKNYDNDTNPKVRKTVKSKLQDYAPSGGLIKSNAPPQSGGLPSKDDLAAEMKRRGLAQ